jgi:GAF domain
VSNGSVATEVLEWQFLVSQVGGRVDQARGARVWAAVSACARWDGAEVSLRHVVIACAQQLGGAGAGFSAVSDQVLREPVLASGPAAEELEELQFTLGQGPGMDAAVRGPVLAADLAAPEAQRRWTAFAPAAAGLGMRGMFAFPVAVGASLIGVLDVYRTRPGPLEAEELAQGLVFADVALVLALDERTGIGSGVDGVADAAASTRTAQVHQATGMVSARLDVSMPDALAILRARAYARGQRLTDLAADVLARQVRLDPGPPGADQWNAPRDGPAPPAGGAREDGTDSPDDRQEEEET